ncbi:MAG: partitioning protein [Hirschia sp.]|nr:partitioning protein [Hirschia sp.]|tara:strand:- start:180 stop:1955 length:1776 start_codon:yes stop_codon:yes gene_type:complete
MQLKYIPINELKVSRLNMRHGRKAPDISDIYPSIKSRGVLQTMLVRKEGDAFGVVAGRRRFFALKRLAKETGKPQKAPCLVMQSGDDIAALEATLVENTTHLPADEFEQYEVFAKLAAKGETTSAIAERFGVTELMVRRVLALTALTDDVKKLYQAEAIDKRTLYALTLATKSQQADWLTLYHSEDAYAPRGERLKDWLTGGGRITTDKALFDMEAYDGVVLTDLFGENAIFADTDLFWARQNEAIADMAAGYRSEGWNDVVILDRGQHFPTWEHGKRSRKQGGKVYVETRHDGTVTAHEGYLPHKDIEKIERILKGETAKTTGGAAKSDRPEMSGPMAEYIALHRHAAVRATLCDHPGVALRLAVAHLVTRSGHWRVDVEEQNTRKEATAESLANSESEKQFFAHRAHALTALGHDDETTLVATVQFGGDPCEIFARLLSLSDADVLHILAVAMGETLMSGSHAVEAAAHVTGTDFAALWSPDEAFFDLLRDKRVINQMVADIASPSTARAVLTDTAKAQKTVVRNRIAGNGCEPHPDWRPRWMTVAPTRYVVGAACPPADAWGNIKNLFETEQDRTDTPEALSEAEIAA